MKKLLTAMSIAAVSAVSSLAIAQQAPDAAEADTSLRLEARLQPVIAVDASGQARLEVPHRARASRSSPRVLRLTPLCHRGPPELRDLPLPEPATNASQL